MAFSMTPCGRRLKPGRTSSSDTRLQAWWRPCAPRFEWHTTTMPSTLARECSTRIQIRSTLLSRVVTPARSALTGSTSSSTAITTGARDTASESIPQAPSSTSITSTTTSRTSPGTPYGMLPHASIHSDGPPRSACRSRSSAFTDHPASRHGGFSSIERSHASMSGATGLPTRQMLRASYPRLASFEASQALRLPGRSRSRLTRAPA